MGGRIRIAILEHDESLHDLLVDILTTGGFEVITATSPELMPEDWRGDVVVTDTFRSLYSVEHVRRHVAALRRFGASVVVLTAHAEAKRDEREIRADAVITKPFDIDALVSELSRIAERRRALA